MENLEIQSTHSLITSMPDSRPVGAHSYQIKCHQFDSAYRDWQKHKPSQGHALAVMTVGFERIWFTSDEATQVAAAIQSKQSPIVIA